MSQNTHIRNIAIIAHVDHGKTTLVDALLKQTGTFESNEKVADRAMDSNDIERERGITILAKTTGLSYKDHRINVVDTPGHADFGSEVERILGMVDGVALLVDASEGPMPQTKFVLGKALGLGLRPILVINKIDRSDSRIDEVVNETFDLFDSLGATSEQLDFPILYAIGRDGMVTEDPNVKTDNCFALLDLVVKHVPAPEADMTGPFKLLGTIVERDSFIGRIVTGRIESGVAKRGMPVKALDRNGKEICRGKIVKLFTFKGLQKVEVETASAGDIVAIAGLPEAFVTHTVCDMAVTTPLPARPIDPPTLAMSFGVNDSPLCGQDGKKLTSREIGNRLEQEAETNVGLTIEPGSTAETFKVFGRGELQLSVLIETMRREGFELSVSRPEIVLREEGGKTLEPYEDIVVDVDEEFSGVVMEKMGLRKAELVNMVADHHGKQRLIFVGPSRGMIGYRSEFLTDTRGTGVLNRQYKEYGPVKSSNSSRQKGVLVSMAQGDTTAYILNELEARGVLFIGPSIAVYDGMIIGENSRSDDLEVNPTHGKKLTNVRASGKDEGIRLTPPRQITLEYALTYIEDDELVEVTPKAIRLRKRGLDTNTRKRLKREINA
ncbi:MAG: translational GTPase TypA [Alphaproteobacteria bacterium CG_4_10_14_0_8_um_filter_53_9]|nr:MAG: translational GTPase TypA [Alphaproteobacteria bacterium CG_4_10_14_0_8_um_filter_53_9]